MKVTLGSHPSLVDGSRKKEKSDKMSDTAQAKPSAAPPLARPPAMDALVRLIREAPEDAQDSKVESLKRAIAEGSYQLSSSQIADALIKETMSYSGIE